MDEYYESCQHLNLSQHAYDVLESDQYEFLDKPSFARILNMVLSSYMEDADASIDNALVRFKAELDERLSAIPDNSTKQAIVSTLIDHYREELVTTANNYPKEHAFKFRLDKENYASVQEWRDDNDYYAGSPGRFLKAVIEEYARKPLFNREGIILRDKIAGLQACIDNHQLIVVTIRGPSRSRFEVRPFSIEHDPGYNYHYLVGYSRKAGTSYEERPVSFRLSRISSIRRSHARSGKVTVEQKRDIIKKLQSVGVQFLLQEPDAIRLKLTPRGKQMYEFQAHLRPAFTNRQECEDGAWIYEFSCTQMQAEFYFFKYGAEVEILFPSTLRNLFSNRYRDAYGLYF